MEDARLQLDKIVPPTVVIDAGGEDWSVLGPVIERRLKQMTAGDVLEIVSEEPHNRVDIPTWCYLRGHDLLHLWSEGDQTRFWIQRGRQ